jgi:hypothetical protein
LQWRCGPYKATFHVFEKGCIVAKKGAISPILREKRPFKKSTPKYDAASGIIAGELLSNSLT